jgi:glutamate dehydrogenase (NAD(P)+)
VEEVGRVEMVVEVLDPVTGVRGALVIDRLVGGVAAGGLRVQPGVDRRHLAELAAAMTRKQAAYGIEIGGAKAGLDMAADHPQRPAVLRRFLAALRPIIEARWSVGPDVNTSMIELEAIARELGLPSLKICVGRARGLDDAEFLRRYAIFEEVLDGWTINQLRGPTAVKAAVEAALTHLGAPLAGARVAVQGAGTMGGGAARLLAAAGALVVAWADDRRCLVDPAGLDVDELLARRVGGRLPAGGAEAPSAAVLSAECDALVLAAIARGLTAEQAPSLRCRAIVEAANLALDDPAARAAGDADVLVVPDLLASAGGSLAVEALYAASPTSGAEVLAHVERRVGEVVLPLLRESARARVPVRALVRRPPPRGGGHG